MKELSKENGCGQDGRIQETGTVYQDERYTLGQQDDRPYLIVDGIKYLLSCQPYEPCLYITSEAGSLTTVHNAFDPYYVLECFRNGGTVTSITGREYDAKDFCRLVEYAAGAGDINIDGAERVFGDSGKAKAPENENYEIEERFVRSFIRKDRRERLIHELTDPRKRYDGVSRFCHQAGDLIDPSKIIMEGEDIDRLPEFERFVRQHDEICFVLSPDFYTDEQFLPLKDAVLKAIISLDAVIIMGSTFAVVFGEPMKGGRGKYLLSERV